MVRIYIRRLLRTLWQLRPFEVSIRRPRPKWDEDIGRFIYQQRFNQFDIPPGSVVLDIGIGSYPFPLATILSDRYLESTDHRNESLKGDGRPFVILDVHNIPMAGKAVDFVYCSHVLEHVEDPAQACAELMRVGRRGYIETPTFGKDTLFSWTQKMHKWHAVAINQTLLFFEYTEQQKQGVKSSWWREKVLGRVYHPLQDLYYNNPEIFNVMFNWSDRFECVVYRLLENSKKLSCVSNS